MKSKYTDWNINISFFIHENFDHAWAKHYLKGPVYIPCSKDASLGSVHLSSQQRLKDHLELQSHPLISGVTYLEGLHYTCILYYTHTHTHTCIVDTIGLQYMITNAPINVMPHYPPCGQCRGICRGILMENPPRGRGLVVSMFRESACKCACIHIMWSF